MKDSVSVRGGNRNVASILCAVCSRLFDADRLELAACGEFDGDLAAARAHRLQRASPSDSVARHGVTSTTRWACRSTARPLEVHREDRNRRFAHLPTAAMLRLSRSINAMCNAVQKVAKWIGG